MPSFDSVRSPEEKKRKESSGSDDLEALGMAESLAELDKLDDIKLRLNNLATSVSSIEMSISQLVLDSKTKIINKSVDELKESLSFCEDGISNLKKNTNDIKCMTLTLH